MNRLIPSVLVAGMGLFLISYHCFKERPLCVSVRTWHQTAQCTYGQYRYILQVLHLSDHTHTCKYASTQVRNAAIFFVFNSSRNIQAADNTQSHHRIFSLLSPISVQVVFNLSISFSYIFFYAASRMPNEKHASHLRSAVMDKVSPFLVRPSGTHCRWPCVTHRWHCLSFVHLLWNTTIAPPQ